jgi:hypothetical protein
MRRSTKFLKYLQQHLFGCEKRRSLFHHWENRRDETSRNFQARAAPSLSGGGGFRRRVGGKLHRVPNYTSVAFSFMSCA